MSSRKFLNVFYVIFYSRVAFVGTCSIRENDRRNQHAIPVDQRAQSPSVYTCVGEHGRDADVHILAVYEGNRHTRPPTAGTMNVNITSSSSTSRPVVLVFANFEPVVWVVNFPRSLSVVKVILVSIMYTFVLYTQWVTNKCLNNRPFHTGWAIGTKRRETFEKKNSYYLQMW